MVDIVILFNAESGCRGLKRALFFILMIGIQNVELLCIAIGKYEIIAQKFGIS